MLSDLRVYHPLERESVFERGFKDVFAIFCFSGVVFFLGENSVGFFLFCFVTDCFCIVFVS